MDKNNRKHVLIICSDSKCQAKGRIFKENEKVVLYQKHSFPYKDHSYLKRLKKLGIIE